MMPLHDWSVRIWLVQAHQGELVQNNYMLSREFLFDRSMLNEGMGAAISIQMDRQMLDAVGHVDESRVWFTDDYAFGIPNEHPPTTVDKVQVLDGPHAGEAYQVEINPYLKVPLIGGGVAEYRVHHIGRVRFGVFLRTDTWLL